LVVVAAIGLVAPTTVHGGSPSRRGRTALGAYEAKASEIASVLAGRSVSIACRDAAAWWSQAANFGFNPARAWAVTPFHWDAGSAGLVPDDSSSFSPRACRYGRAFWVKPSERGARICRIGAITRWRRRSVERLRWRRVRARVNGKLVWRSVRQNVRVQVRVPVNSPLYGECDDWESKLTAVHVLAHESMHLYGIRGEAVAECFGVQLDAYVASEFGAAPGFARAIAREYWRSYYSRLTDAYRSPDCRDGGPLDLFPDRPGWPTPTTYPADLASSISSIRLPASGGSRSP
jgi:hypothetical protein